MATPALAVLTIGYSQYLMPRAKALKAAELMGDAVHVDADWQGDCISQVFISKGAARVEITFISPEQVRMSEPVIESASARRRRGVRAALTDMTRGGDV